MRDSRAARAALTNPSGMLAEKLREEHGAGNREQGTRDLRPKAASIVEVVDASVRPRKADGGFAARFGGVR